MSRASDRSTLTPAAPDAARRTLRWALAGAVVGLLTWCAILWHARPTVVGDEYRHLNVTRALASGDAGPAWALPMPPTFHYLAAEAMRAFGEQLWVVRTLTVGFSVLVLLAWYWAAAARPGGDAVGAFLRGACCPLLVPYWGLAYTDVPALLGVVVALGLHLRRRHGWAALALLVACAFRQSNVLWAALFLAWDALDAWSPDRAKPPGDTRPLNAPRSPAAAQTPRSTRRFDAAASRAAWPAVWPVVWQTARAAAGRAVRCGWPYLALPLAFVLAALLVPAGHVLPRAENRPDPNRAQFYMLTLLLAAFWAPTWIPHFVALWRSHLERALARPLAAAGFVAALGVLDLEFRNPHAWNLDPGFVRNWVLAALTYWSAARYAGGIIIIAVLVTLASQLWHSPARRRLVILWAATAAFLLPHALVDPRYYITPLLLLDFATPWPPRESVRLTLWYGVLCVGIGLVMVYQPGGIWGGW